MLNGISYIKTEQISILNKEIIELQAINKLLHEFLEALQQNFLEHIRQIENQILVKIQTLNEVKALYNVDLKVKLAIGRAYGINFH